MINPLGKLASYEELHDVPLPSDEHLHEGELVVSERPATPPRTNGSAGVLAANNSSSKKIRGRQSSVQHALLGSDDLQDMMGFTSDTPRETVTPATPADQNLLAPTMTAIADEFGFDDKQKDLYLGAYISGAFFAVGAPAALLVGYISDRANRKWLLCGLVLLGEAPCIATIAVTSYWHLFVLRVLTGISLGGSLPLAFSMVGDLYGSKQRAAVLALVQISTGAGIAMGQAIAGFVGPWLGWRVPFVVVAIPALAVTALLAATTIDPPRGAADEALQAQVDQGFVYHERMDWQKMKTLVHTKSSLFSILQGLPGCLPWGIILIYLNDFLAIPSGRNLGVATATAVVLTNGIGGAVGVLGGGALGQWLYNRDKPSMPSAVGLGIACAVVPMYLLINIPWAGGWVAFAFVLSFLVGVLSGAPGPNIRAIILETNPPEARGMALALQTVLDDLGRGLGPFVIGLLVQVTSRQVAFNIAVLGWIPCGALIFGTRIFWGGCMHLYAPKRCCSSLHAITAARWYIVKEVDAMQQHLLHVAARCGAAVVEPPGSDAWGGDDEHHEVLPTSNAAPGMRAGAGLRTVEMQSVVEEDSKRGALLPPSYTPSDAA